VRHGVKCGFAGELAYLSRVMTGGFSPRDPRRRPGSLQGSLSPAGRPEISPEISKKGSSVRDQREKVGKSQGRSCPYTFFLVDGIKLFGKRLKLAPGGI